jgi:hypothetical protein
MVKIKFTPDFSMEEDDDIVFELENEFENLKPIPVEEAISRTLCFNSPNSECKCKSSLECKSHKDYRPSALSAIMVILTADPQGYIIKRLDEKDLN